MNADPCRSGCTALLKTLLALGEYKHYAPFYFNYLYQFSQLSDLTAIFVSVYAGGSSGGGSHSNAGPGEGKDVVELTESNFRKKVLNSEKVSWKVFFKHNFTK